MSFSALTQRIRVDLPDPDGPHRYLTVNSEQVEKTKAKLVELCIQPPQK